MTDAVNKADEAVVEAIASAMWEYDNALFAHHNIAEMQSIAHAAITALRAHDEARGMVLVPREPTAEMLSCLVGGYVEWNTLNFKSPATKAMANAWERMFEFSDALSASREGEPK